ncbi:MAG: T9SS type A sorting domain-containing protein [Bacteroidetes bacterium]|nr:T9SS type A sorting domain-containing protein [Bacteroidota bacterium]
MDFCEAEVFPECFKLEVSVTPACDSTCNGTATFEWSGGIPPYTISFNGTDYTNVGNTMSSVLDSLCGGDTVCINIMDANFASIFTCVPIPVSVPVVYITLPQYKPCKGDTIMLAGGETVHYIWKTGLDTIAYTDTIYVSPQVPTWYYLTGIDSFGCVNYDTALVDVDTFMIYVNITDTNFCDNDSGFIKLEVQTNMTDSVTYQWEPASGLNTTTGAVVYASPTVTTTYTVYGHHNTCTVRDTIVVRVDCCVPIQPKRVKTTGENSSQNQWLSSGNLSHSRLDIQGHLTIDAPLTLQYDTISVYSNKQIIVQSGVTLTIQNSILYACKDMWSGIRLEPGATLNISNSIILDADTALVSRSNAAMSNGYGYYNLNHTIFNKNRYGIVQMPHPDLSNTHINIRGCTFDCQSNALWSAGDNLKAPYNNEKSHTAIVMDMSIDEPVLTIGDASSFVYRNEIKQHQYGIRSFGGRLSLVNSYIHHLYSVGGCTAITGVGLWHKGGNLYVTSVGNSYDNVMDNCRVGVLYEGGSNNVVSIVGNSFSNIGNNINCSIGQVPVTGAVWLRQTAYTDIGINSNQINLCSRGIRMVSCTNSNITCKYNKLFGCESGIIVRETAESDVTIFQNEINQDMLPGTYGTEGINVSQLVGVPVAVTISGNLIRKVRRGIVGNNCDRILVEQNQIEFPQNIGGAVKYGIILNACERGVVRQNLIVKQGPAAQNSQKDQLFGINIELSSKVQIHNNIIARCGTAIRIMGNNAGGLNAPADIQCNRMVDNFYGVRLDAAGIGSQGDEELPSDNRWEILTGNNNTNILDYVTTYNSSSEWWVRDDSGRPWWLNTYFPNMPLNSVVSDTSITSQCSYDFSTPLNRRVEYGDIIRNRNSYSLEYINPANDYQFKWQVFNYIIHDSSYLNFGDTLDIHFTAFADTFKTTVAGMIGNINEYLRRGDTLQAQAYLSTLVPGDSAEYVYGEVLSIYERSWARGVYDLDSTLYADAHQFAIRHPHSSGAAVFMARTMCDVFYDDFLNEAQGSRIQEESKDSSLSTYLLFPNPNNGFFSYMWAQSTQEMKELCIYDNNGRLCLQQSVQGADGYTILNLSKYPAGMYMLQLRCNAAICDTRKIVKQ